MQDQDIHSFWEKKLDEGQRHIALTNVGHIALQQKYILLVLLHLANETSLRSKRVAVVSFHFNEGLYKSILSDSYSKHSDFLLVPNKTKADFISWNFLIDNKIPTSYMEAYDLIIWDLPDLNFINRHCKELEKFFALFDSLSIISIKPNGTDERNHIGRINNFFSSHGFKLPDFSANSSTRSKKSQMLDLVRKAVGF